MHTALLGISPAHFLSRLARPDAPRGSGLQVFRNGVLQKRTPHQSSPLPSAQERQLRILQAQVDSLTQLAKATPTSRAEQRRQDLLAAKRDLQIFERRMAR